MSTLNVRLLSPIPAPSPRPWRDTFFFLVSFLAVFGASTIMLDHAAVLLS